MCPNGATCLPADCCFSELALYKSISACWHSAKQISSSSHCKIAWSRHDIAEKMLALNNNNSLTYHIIQTSMIINIPEIVDNQSGESTLSVSKINLVKS